MLDIDKLIKEVTLEEKAGLCSGMDNWRTKGVEWLSLKSVKVADGPSGLRVEWTHGSSTEAVCYLSDSTLSFTFNKKNAYKLGDALGRKARNVGLHTLLEYKADTSRGKELRIPERGPVSMRGYSLPLM